MLYYLLERGELVEDSTGTATRRTRLFVEHPHGSSETTPSTLQAHISTYSLHQYQVNLDMKTDSPILGSPGLTTSTLSPLGGPI
jgi:hypothetical protein